MKYVVAGCTNRKHPRTIGVSFHRFPKDECTRSLFTFLEYCWEFCIVIVINGMEKFTRKEKYALNADLPEINQQTVITKKLVLVDGRPNANALVLLTRIQGNQHSHEEFDIHCSCASCIQYREDVIFLFADQKVSENLWRTVKTFLQESYGSMFSCYPQAVLEKTIFNDSNWRVNGYINKSKKRFIMHASSCFSKEMNFIFCCSLLQIDDSHQLMELICCEIECIIRAYVNGVLARRQGNTQTNLTIEDKITFIIRGYEKLCDVASKISALLFKFENTYLQKFQLTFLLLNKRIYQKIIYPTFKEMVAFYISKLGEPAELLIKILKYNDDMMEVHRKWRFAWEALNKFHMSKEDKERRDRIRVFNNLFDNIKRNFDDDLLCKKIDIFEWDTCEDREELWQTVLSYIRNYFKGGSKLRLNATCYHEKCISCKMWSDNHKIFCKCVTCLIAGPNYSNYNEDLVKSLCFKCALVQKAISEEYNLMSYLNLKNSIIFKMKRNECEIETDADGDPYHICWVILKHKKDFRNYNNKKMENSLICKNCTWEDCMISMKIINNEIDKELVKLIMNHFHPTCLTQHEVEAIFPNISCYIHTMLNAGIYPFVNSENLVFNPLWTFCCSIFIRHVININENTKEWSLGDIRELDDYIDAKIVYTEGIQPHTIRNYVLKYIGNDIDWSTAFNMKELKEVCYIAEDPEEYDICSIDGDCLSVEIVNKNKLRKKLKAQNPMTKVPYLCSRDKSLSDGSKKSGMKSTENTKKSSQGTNMESWIKKTLNFIEGDQREQPTNRKAEKKIRQRLKKEEVRRIQELYNFKSQYHEIYFKELATKGDLKVLQSMKKKEKKKILELENNLKKWSSAKSRIEKNILELLRIVKSTNSNFKLSYLPTKEDQETANNRRTVLGSEKGYVTLVKKQFPDEYSSPLKQVDVPIFTEDSINVTNVSHNMVTDPSKRIVTIRRVNIPNLSEPQVTVTAKGISPEDDKLLYTFINGQIIPASSLDMQMQNILASRPVASARAGVNPLLEVKDPRKDSSGNSSYGQNTLQLREYQCAPIADVTIHENEMNIKGSCRGTDVHVCKVEHNFVNRKYPNDYWKYSTKPNLNSVIPKINCSVSADESMLCNKFQSLLLKSNQRGCLKDEHINLENPVPNIGKCKKKSLKAKKQNGLTQNTEDTDKFICQKIKKLNLEPDDPFKARKESNSNVNISIMEQINRGVKVEELTLPPGITLTKVDPSNADKLKAKKKSIETISYPMLSVNPSPLVLLPQDVSIQTITNQQVLYTQNHQKKYHKVVFDSKREIQRK